MTVGAVLAGTTGLGTEVAVGLGNGDGGGELAGGRGDGASVANGVPMGPDADAMGVGVGTTAIAADGVAEPVARCCNSTPPIPNAIVARTRFRTPRLRTSRAR
jgi:hypothetical protein